ncbi:MAG: ribonuclease H-like domain-containing protein [Lachnospiraceae bacterium]|nr:ribonuclease H-like domain-containing protein [Lachnospiraceae bacterium]
MRILNKEYTMHRFSPFLAHGDVILDYITDGLFWRTSKTEELSLLFYDDEKKLRETRYISEQESDEYDILEGAASLLSSAKRIITFNGNSFDIPHLKSKLKAYGLPDPFPGKKFADLYLQYRGLYQIFGLPSRSLDDFLTFLQIRPKSEDENMTDAEKTAEITALYAYIQFAQGNYTLKKTELEADRLVFSLDVPVSFPVRAAIPEGPFYLIFDHDQAVLSVKTEEMKIRVYHEDWKNYDFLIHEGYAIHRSMSAFVDKKHKRKAVREDCFSYYSVSEVFLSSEKQQLQYLSSALRFLLPLR